MLQYCKKCGRIVLDSKNCSCCNSQTYPVPEKYWLDGLDFLISTESKILLREELVKTSPDFDQYLFEHRDEILAKQSAEFNAKMEHGRAVLEEASRVPKCPTCQSTNIRKVSVTSKAVSVGLFGIFSQKVKKQFHCNSCGYEW